MTLEEFLTEVDEKEGDITTYGSNEEALAAVKQDGYALQYVHNQTLGICLVAVKSYGSALKFVHNQTPEICLAAVKQNGYALLHVRNQTPEICLTAVKQEKEVLRYVDKTIFDRDKTEDFKKKIRGFVQKLEATHPDINEVFAKKIWDLLA